MTKFNLFLRRLWLCLPVLLISGAAIVAVSAQTATPAVTPGKISVKGMPDFEAYPSGVNGLAAANPPPLIMLVMSRDEQLFNKAYSDYTPLDESGSIKTTYDDTFTYKGYFDPNICYTYSSSAYYQADSLVGGVTDVTAVSKSHRCGSGKNTSLWSGNFLNWVAMSRVDILRWAFYGGTRSTDVAKQTILERAEIPDDLHAWAKVYSGSDINYFAPFTDTTTFCNVSKGTTGGFTAPTTTSSGISSTPVIRTASGSWGDWATTAKLQCQWRSSNGTGEGDSARPKSGTDYTARVQVCRATAGVPNEAICVQVGSSLKPEGLLQKYSKSGESQKRFGLVTGSTVQARIGGQLRRNIGQLSNNKPGTPCAAGTGAGDGDEFSATDGTFCYKSKASTEGIVMTLDRLRVTGWDGGDYGTSGNGCYLDASHPWGARGYAIQGNPTRCPDFGNPLAGMYATALQYIQAPTSPPALETGGTLPTPSWVDPYEKFSDGTSRNKECATCSIVLVSSGLNTFDKQNVPAVDKIDAAAMTDAIAADEGISGNYMLSTYNNPANGGGSEPANGSLTVAGTNYSDAAICQPATIGKLSDVAGLCNGAPGQQGSYLLAGLAYGAWNADGTKPIRTSNVSGQFKVKTYGVSLSDSLPSFTIPVGTGSVSLSPSCRADAAGTGNLTTCYIGSVRLGAQAAYTGYGSTVYGLQPTTGYPNVGSYYFIWEDSQYGSDHDQDAANIISYCVGSSCSQPSSIANAKGVSICDPVVMNGNIISGFKPIGDACNSNGTLKFVPGPNDIVIRNQLVAYSSSKMALGYQISGSSTDGLTEFTVYNDTTNDGTANHNGSQFNCNLLGNASGNANNGKGCNSRPQVSHFTLGTTAPVPLLQSPLWYAAKYSGFDGSTPQLPEGATDPDNYFFARNAGALKDKLNIVFQKITSSAANNFGNATTPSSSNDVQGSGLSYQVQYYQERNSIKWTGSLQAFWSDSDGYQREGTDSGAQELKDDAKYVVSGKDKSDGALAGAMTSYRCSVMPEGVDFDASTNANCSMVTAANVLHPAWDAGTWLNAYYDPTAASGSTAATAIANLAKQRTYSSATDLAGNSQRYIFTYLTATPNGKSATGTVVDGTQTDFVWKDTSCDATGKYTLSATSGFCGSSKSGVRTGNYGLLNELDPTMAKKLVNWVRGVEYPDDYRSRTGSIVADPSKGITAATYTYRLGDIVDSSPMIVGTPAESYDLLYSDYTFAAFRSNYRDRRQMVYVGANDGMLHAFNGGFYIPGHVDSDPTKSTNPTIVRQLTSDSNMKTGSSKSTLGQNWQLGQEVWAFIPDNLLPHLRWLADKNYSHVFYVDGSPVVSDVQAFTTTSDPTTAACAAGTSTVTDDHGHVCGWGTVMVVPFRLGGGAISVDTVGDGKDASIEQSNSAYVILDVTDPEQPPTVLGEITMGTYTTAAPAFSVHREADGKLHYLLTIGSGPVDNGGPNGSSGDKPVAAASGSKLEVRVYDLADIVAKKSAAVATLADGPDNSFAGDMVASDFDLNNSSEAIYFGVVTNPSDPDMSKATGVFGGGLWKLDMNTAPADEDGNAATVTDTSDPSTWALEQVIDTEQPVTIRPTLALDPTGRAMVYFGTGRSFTTNDDSGSSYQGVQQQYIYGVSDNSLLSWLSSDCKEMPATGPLFDASDVEVDAEGNVAGLPEDLEASANKDTLVGALTAVDPDTGCYKYSGWKMELAAGDRSASKQQPSERVVSSQVLYRIGDSGILLTPTYIPANLAARIAAKQSECNPVPVPGTSNLYGMNYVTGTADPSLAKSFGVSGDYVNKKVSLGSGKASSPVLHVGNGKVTAALGLSGGTKLQEIGALGAANNGEISWREPMDNQ
jgi:type IV pilus assembly protein PilY1